MRVRKRIAVHSGSSGTMVPKGTLNRLSTSNTDAVYEDSKFIF